MKVNTQKSKEYLKRALTEIANDPAFIEARGYLKAALNKIEQVEVKNSKKVQYSHANKWRDTISGINNHNVNSLTKIENMIEDTKRELEELKKNKIKSQEIIDEEEEQTLID